VHAPRGPTESLKDGKLSPQITHFPSLIRVDKRAMNGACGQVQLPFMLGNQSCNLLNSSSVTEVLMLSHALFATDSTPPHVPAVVFELVFMACAEFTPNLLIVYAFTISPDSIERAQNIVQGLESTVLMLVAILILGASYLFSLKNGSLHQNAKPGCC
jgi:hypothetical protein